MRTATTPARSPTLCRHLLASLVTALVGLFPGSSQATRTNIVVMVADDLGWADIGYNNLAVYTPTLDALAAGGVRFTHHYVMSQCTPTRVALFTGRYPSRSGTQAQQASNVQSYAHGTLTLSSMLSAVGYETAMAGKWHMGSAPEWGPNHHGFDESYGSMAGAVGMYDHRYRPSDTYEVTWHRNLEIIPGYENGTHATDLVAAEAIRFIQQPHDRPFFLFLPFHAPHTPLDERGSFTNTPTQLDPADPTRWLNEDNIPWFNDPAGKIQAETDPEMRLLLATVYHLDSAISNIVTALNQTGLRESTVIFFSSDNGPQVDWGGNAYPDDLKLTDFNQPDTWRGFKTDVYEGGTLVPGFINWPAKLPPRVVTNPVHIVDWLPTIADMVDYVPSGAPHWDGTNIMPLVNGSGTVPDRPLYWLWGSGSSRWAIRHGNWKTVHYGEEPAAASDWQLFNLGVDPTESTNLAATETNKLNEMHALFLAEREKDLKGKLVSPRLVGPATATGPFSVQVTFTEAVTGLEVTEFAVSNATGSALSGSDASYTLTVTPTVATNGQVRVVLPAGQAAASGGRSNAPSNELMIMVDTTPQPPDITSGLISHYTFDRNARNSISSAPPGALVGGAQTAMGEARIGDGYLALDGVDDHVSTTTNGYPNSANALSAGTLGMWVKTTTTQVTALAGTLNDADGTAFLWQINFGGTEDASRLLVRDQNDGTGSQQFDSTLNINDGEWHHAAITWGPDPTDAGMYIDGTRVAISFPYANRQSTSGAAFTPWEFPMTLGARNNRGDVIAHLNGAIDDVRLYNRVLTTTDIQALATMPPSAPGAMIMVK